MTNEFKIWYRKELSDVLSNPSGYTWTIYNCDNAKIGDIAESDYLNAKHEADLCWSTKLLQGLNYLLVVWCTIVRLFAVLPGSIVIILLALLLTTPQDQFANITLGQALVGISETWPLIPALLSVMVLFVLGLFAATGRTPPGYKNFYNPRLKRLLAWHVPNIANADGYRVVAWKICPESTGAEAN